MRGHHCGREPAPALNSPNPAASAAPEHDLRTRRRVVTFVFITVFLDLIGFGIIIPLLPLYVQTMGGTAQVVGFILSSFSFTQLLATPVLGRLSDRIGRRPVILLSLAGNAASMLIFALATKMTLLPLLFASRILAGATAGNLSACQAAIADVTTGDDRAKGMGRLGAAIGLGMVLGPVLGSTLARFGGWAPPLGAAVMAMADLIAAYFFMPETRAKASPDQGPPSRAPKQTLGQVLADRRILMVMCLYFLVFMCITNLQVALALLAKVRLAWGETEVGELFALFGAITLIIQGGLIGKLVHAFGQLNVVIAGCVLTMLGLLVIGSAHHPVTMLVGTALMGSGIGVSNPILATLASTYAGEKRRGAVLGFAQSAGGLARTIGPVWGGFLFTRIGPGAPFAGGAIAAFLSIFLGLMLKKENASRAT